MNVWLPVAGYLLGSIPFAYLIARHVGGVDVRRHGSGNAGAANVMRTAGVPLGLAVALLDVAKGAAAVWIVAAIGADAATRAATALAAVLGHIYPVWLGFRGGKGVAVAAGAFGVIAPVATCVAFGIFAVATAVTRYVSVGSVLAAVSLPAFVIAFDADGPAWWSAAAAVLILVRHRSNVRRLLNRAEPRLGEPA